LVISRGDEPVARAFPVTRHSTLAAIRGADEDERRRGLEKLANAYWRPVYGYLRLHWRLGHDDAADLAQEFFAELVDVKRDLLARFDPNRIKARTIWDFSAGMDLDRYRTPLTIQVDQDRVRRRDDGAAHDARPKLRQLLGRAGKRQLKNPVFGLTHNLGGVPYNGVAAISILGLWAG